MNMQSLKENYLIRIRSRIVQDGDEPQFFELTTRGSYVRRGGSYYITYKETETTGYEGCVTTLKVALDAGRVTMLRFGPAQAQLVIEKGRRNLCHYETGFGSLTMGVTADRIESALNEQGGRISFGYLLDNNAAETISRNSMEITVTPAGQ